MSDDRFTARLNNDWIRSSQLNNDYSQLDRISQDANGERLNQTHNHNITTEKSSEKSAHLNSYPKAEDSKHEDKNASISQQKIKPKQQKKLQKNKKSSTNASNIDTNFDTTKLSSTNPVHHPMETNHPSPLPANDFNDDFIPKSFLEEAHVAILDAHKELGEAQSVCEKLLYKCREQSAKLLSQATNLSDMEVDLRACHVEIAQYKFDNESLARQVKARGDLARRLQSSLKALTSSTTEKEDDPEDTSSPKTDSSNSLTNLYNLCNAKDLEKIVKTSREAPPSPPPINDNDDNATNTNTTNITNTSSITATSISLSKKESFRQVIQLQDDVSKYLERALKAEEQLANYRRIQESKGARVFLRVWFSKVQHFRVSASNHAVCLIKTF